MQFAHNGYYKGSTPLGLIILIINLSIFLLSTSPTCHKGKKRIKKKKINIRVFGRVWFMALVLKTSTLKKS